MVSTPGFSIFATIRCRSSISQQRRPLPGRAPYKNEVVQRWTAEIARSDSFIFVAPDITTALRGPQGCDRLGLPSGIASRGFVSYGSAMGARGVQQLD